MIDLDAHMRAYLRHLPSGDFSEFLLEQAAEEIADKLDRFGPPDIRIRFVAALLRAMGADDDRVETLAVEAAKLTAPDYFEDVV